MTALESSSQLFFNSLDFWLRHKFGVQLQKSILCKSYLNSITSETSALLSCRQ